jgi:hypothetical protein
VARAKKSEDKQARRFAMILSILLALLAVYSYWRHHHSRSPFLLGAGVAVLAFAFLVPALWQRAFRAWMKFAEILSFVMTRVILTIFYYGFATPYGLISRLFRSDPLDLDWKRRRASYWIERPDEEPARERYEKQY